MGENVKRTAEKLSSSKKVDEAREAELRAAEELAAFEEKLNQLLLLAKKKKNVLENQEVLDFFTGTTLDADRLDQIYDFLETNKVDVLQINEDEDLSWIPIYLSRKSWRKRKKSIWSTSISLFRRASALRTLSACI